MTGKKLDFRGQAFKDVLGFTFHHWAQQPWRIVVIAALVMLSAVADVLTPMFAGRLVDEDPLDAVERELDQCWDLLRQRRAREEFGENPDEAKERPVSEVEGYLQ